MFKTTRFGRVGFATAASSVVASLFCMDAVAAPQASPERIALREASALHALGGSTLPVLDRRAGPGNTVTAERVFNALASTSFAPGSTVVAMRSVAAAAPFGEHVMAHGPSWLLDVGSEGQYVRFTAKQPGVGVPFDERPSYDAVVALGRAATSGELASLVPLGPDESLEPVSVSYVQNAVFTSDGHEEREVIQSRVLFARAVAGVAVVGGGSTVRAGFDNSGQLVDIRIDWSSLERTTTTQATVGADEVASRLAILEGAGLVPRERDLRHVECGYYDPGTTTGRALDVVQPACVYEFQAGSGSIPASHGFVEWAAVPAGVRFIADALWPESGALPDAE